MFGWPSNRTTCTAAWICCTAIPYLGPTQRWPFSIVISKWVGVVFPSVEYVNNMLILINIILSTFFINLTRELAGRQGLNWDMVATRASVYLLGKSKTEIILQTYHDLRQGGWGFVQIDQLLEVGCSQDRGIILGKGYFWRWPQFWTFSNQNSWKLEESERHIQHLFQQYSLT